MRWRITYWDLVSRNQKDLLKLIEFVVPDRIQITERQYEKLPPSPPVLSE